MKFFLDTADINEIKDLAETGMVDGVTTNPSLIAKSGRNFLEAVREICAIVPGPVSAEVDLDVGGGNVVTAVITLESAKHLGLKQGSEAHALFKASSVIVGVR